MSEYTNPADAVAYVESATWETTIYMAPDDVFVVGGAYTLPTNLHASGAPVGNYNLPLQQLANRTEFLRDLLLNPAIDLGNPGRIVFPGGFTIQWGQTLVADGAALTVNYAEPFVSTLLAGCANVTDPVQTGYATIRFPATNPDALQFMEVLHSCSSDAYITWIVIGF